MSRYAYYERLKSLARDVRKRYGLNTPRVLRSHLRQIYRAEGIQLDLWPHKFKQLRGAYFYDDLGATVVIAKSLPPEPRIFTMAHELKHHLVDRHLGLSYCDATNESEPVEIGAEVFAAELIFPEADFLQAMSDMAIGRGQCTAEGLVRLKYATQTTLSYASLGKRAEFLGLARAGVFKGVRWRSLEESLFGIPFYRAKPHRRS